MDNIISLVSSGKLVKNNIWLGGCSGMTAGVVPEDGGTMCAVESLVAAA